MDEYPFPFAGFLVDFSFPAFLRRSSAFPSLSLVWVAVPRFWSSVGSPACRSGYLLPLPSLLSLQGVFVCLGEWFLVAGLGAVFPARFLYVFPEFS